MRADKASLRLGDTNLTARIVAMLGAVADVVVVVGRDGQTLPPLPEGVERVDDDPQWGDGPLVGLSAGLDLMAARAVEIAFTCAVDAVFLDDTHVAWALARAGDGAWMPETEANGRAILHPLAGALPVPVAAVRAHELLEAGERSAKALYAALDATRSREMPDPGALRGCNTAEEWAAAQRELGVL
jgi:molybdopterin-guanine dinucleotide biosynthesis protein A